MLHRRMATAILFCSLIPNLAESQETTGAHPQQEAILKSITDYVKAINEGDAATAAACWGEEGVWIDPYGQEIIGAAEIEQHLNASFDAGRMPKIELLDVNVRFIADNVATEEGHVILMRPGQPPQKSTYISIHTLTDSGWKLDSIRQTVIPDPDAAHPKLLELEWMVGDWIDREGDMSVETKCEWTSGRNFLVRTYRAHNAGVLEIEGTQVIGWDAAKQQIRSWVFDSDGGFGHGFWTRDGTTWTVNDEFQNADGQKGSSVNKYTWLDDQSFTYESINRVMNGEELPDVEAFTISRVPETTEEGTEK